MFTEETMQSTDRDFRNRKKGEKKISVSVLIVTYRADWKKLKRTLDSVLRQHLNDAEIVVADDGSENNHEWELKEYFRQRGVENYRLILNAENRGTVSNMISGLVSCRGKWVKDLGPGDLLNDEYRIMDWIQYNENKGLIWSFSEAVYYTGNDQSGFRVLQKDAKPCDIRPYMKERFQQCRWNYIVLDDISIGATMLCRTEVYLAYCRRLEGKVIYAEDNAWRLMMFDGIPAGYYPKPAVFYEYGDGVSTSEDSVWAQKIRRDWEITSQMMYETENPDSFQQKMISARQREQNPFIRYIIKGRIRIMLLKKIKPRQTGIHGAGGIYDH